MMTAVSEGDGRWKRVCRIQDGKYVLQKWRNLSGMHWITHWNMQHIKTHGEIFKSGDGWEWQALSSLKVIQVSPLASFVETFLQPNNALQNIEVNVVRHWFRHKRRVEQNLWARRTKWAKKLFKVAKWAWIYWSQNLEDNDSRESWKFSEPSTCNFKSKDGKVSRNFWSYNRKFRGTRQVGLTKNFFDHWTCLSKLRLIWNDDSPATHRIHIAVKEVLVTTIQ